MALRASPGGDPARSLFLNAELGEFESWGQLSMGEGRGQWVNPSPESLEGQFHALQRVPSRIRTLVSFLSRHVSNISFY